MSPSVATASICSNKRLLLLALLTIVIAAAATSASSQQRGRPSSLFSIFVRMKKSHCHSEVQVARQTWRQCFRQCLDARRQRGRSRWRHRFQFTSCHLRCLHRFVLVTPASGDAYDKQVTAAGCDSQKSWAACRGAVLQKLADGAEVVSQQLSEVQRYNVLVCQHHCGGEDPAGCKALCLLGQVMEPEAFKKLSSCLEDDCAKEKSGTRKDRCKKRCYRKC